MLNALAFLNCNKIPSMVNREKERAYFVSCQRLWSTALGPAALDFLEGACHLTAAKKQQQRRDWIPTSHLSVQSKDPTSSHQALPLKRLRVTQFGDQVGKV